MEINININKKRVLIWLTHAESENVALREALKPFYIRNAESKGVGR